jgi:hypothetical protein
MNTQKISDLSVDEFKALIQNTIIETIQGILAGELIPEIDDEEQRELEEMFGKSPQPEEYIFEKKIQL